MSLQRGDDLDDDFLPDEIFASSDVEASSDDQVGGAGNDIERLLSADEAETPVAKQPDDDRVNEKKRKRGEKRKEKKAKVRPQLLVPCARSPAVPAAKTGTDRRGRRARIPCGTVASSASRIPRFRAGGSVPKTIRFGTPGQSNIWCVPVCTVA
jgi:hypothetical protein